MLIRCCLHHATDARRRALLSQTQFIKRGDTLLSLQGKRIRLEQEVTREAGPMFARLCSLTLRPKEGVAPYLQYGGAVPGVGRVGKRIVDRRCCRSVFLACGRSVRAAESIVCSAASLGTSGRGAAAVVPPREADAGGPRSVGAGVSPRRAALFGDFPLAQAVIFRCFRRSFLSPSHGRCWDALEKGHRVGVRIVNGYGKQCGVSDTA